MIFFFRRCSTTQTSALVTTTLCDMGCVRASRCAHQKHLLLASQSACRKLEIRCRRGNDCSSKPVGMLCGAASRLESCGTRRHSTGVSDKLSSSYFLK